MKVLAIVADLSESHLGGAESHFVEVLKRVAPKIESITVFVGPNVPDFPDIPNIMFRTIKYPHITNLHGLFYILFAAPIAILESLKYQPDLIWAKQEYPQAQIGALIKIVTGKPLYITSQNPNLIKEEFSGPLKFFSDLLTPLIAFSFHQADVVAAVSSYSANQARKLGAKKVIIIPNGVDLAKYKIPNTKYRIPKILNLVTTSSLIPRNGIDILIKSCQLLPIKWQLTIAGDGPEEKSLRQLARGLPVLFLGRVSNSKIAQLLRQSTIFVRPSRFEGFGSSFIEAMAAGLPIVGTSIGGIVDFLKDEETGLVVPVDNPEILAKVIERLAKDRNLYQRLQANGRRLVKEKYDWGIVAPKVLRVFRQLIHDK